MSLARNTFNPLKVFEEGWKYFFTGKNDGESNGITRTRGLRNIGNTCFLNSVLQAASSCPLFVAHINEVANCSEGGPFVNQLSRCLIDLRCGGGFSVGPVHPNNLLKLLAKHNPEFGGFNEQDALEAFESILSCLTEENNELLKGMKDADWHKMLNISHTIIPSTMLSKPPIKSASFKVGTMMCPFEGWIASQLQCQTCKESEGDQSLRWMPSRHQVFTTLPLPIAAPPPSHTQSSSNRSRSSAEEGADAVNLKGGNPVGGVGRYKASSGSIEAAPTIYSCLQEFFRAEELSGITCSACSSAGTLASMQRQLSVLQRKAARGAASEKQQQDGSQAPQALPTEAVDLQVCVPEAVFTDTWASSVIAAAMDDLKKLRVVGTSDAFIQDFDSGFMKIISPLTNQVELVKRTSARLQASCGGSPNSVATPPGGSCSPAHGGDKELLLLSLKQRAQSDAVKHTALSRLPPLLCLYLCRRVYDEGRGKMKKIAQHVSFPVILNMDQFCGLDGAAKTEPKAAAPVSVSAMLGARMGQLGSKRSREYMLRAVVEHRGNSETGHYVAYCLVAEKPQRVWELFSDEKHVQVSEAHVLAAQATMLFYDRIPAR